MVSNRSNGSDKRGLDKALIGYILAAIIAVGFYWLMFYYTGYQSGSHQERAQIERKHYAADTGERVDRECSTKPPTALRECVTKIVDAERENKRDESDLAAQWQAADWVLWAAIIAGAQLIATVIGLYFLKGTLDATWKAVRDTGKATDAMQRQNEIAEAAQRAWVFVKSIQILRNPEGDKIRIIFFNFGQWPAMCFAREAIARNLTYPFAAYPLDKPAREFMTFIPPQQEEVIEITDFKLKTGPNMKTRVYLVWSYRIPGGTHTEHQDWVVDCENNIWSARKFVPYDSANYRKNMHRTT